MQNWISDRQIFFCSISFKLQGWCRAGAHVHCSSQESFQLVLYRTVSTSMYQYCLAAHSNKASNEWLFPPPCPGTPTHRLMMWAGSWCPPQSQDFPGSRLLRLLCCLLIGYCLPTAEAASIGCRNRTVGKWIWCICIIIYFFKNGCVSGWGFLHGWW